MFFFLSFFSVLSIWFTVGREAIGCTSLKIISRVAGSAAQTHPIPSVPPPKRGLTIQFQVHAMKQQAELTQLSSCRFLKLLSMLHYMSVAPNRLKSEKKALFLSTSKDSAYLSD